MGGRIAAGRLACAGVGLLLLGGCAGSGATGAGSADSGNSFGNLLAFNSLKAPPPPVVDPNAEPVTCPTIEVLDGTAASRVYGAGEQTNANVKYQFSLGDVVRECSHEGPNIVVKIGVEGRVLIGPAGGPGSFTAPVRIAIRRNKDEKVIAAKFYKVPVGLQGGESQAPFTLVSEPLAVPFISAHGDEDYTILVGFDAKGDNAAAGVSPRKRRHKGA
jgi:hypothetical protein